MGYISNIKQYDIWVSRILVDLPSKMRNFQATNHGDFQQGIMGYGGKYDQYIYIYIYINMISGCCPKTVYTVYTPNQGISLGRHQRLPILNESGFNSPITPLKSIGSSSLVNHRIIPSWFIKRGGLQLGTSSINGGLETIAMFDYRRAPPIQIHQTRKSSCNLHILTACSSRPP